MSRNHRLSGTLKDTRSNAISVSASTQKRWCGVVLRLSLWRA